MQTHRSKQTVVLAGLTLGLVVTGLSPLLDGHERRGEEKSKSAATRGDVTAEAIQDFSNAATVSLGP